MLASREIRDTGCPILGSECAVGAREARANSRKFWTSNDQMTQLERAKRHSEDASELGCVFDQREVN